MEAKSLPYKAGAASVSFTPDEPLWLAGFVARSAPARGKISDLHASALALEDSTGQRFVFVSADIIAVTPAISEPVAEAARSRHGLARQQLLMTASHTHYAPEYRPDKQVFFNIPAEYVAKFPEVAATLQKALTQAIDEAISRLTPARLVARKAIAGFAHNRRRNGTSHGAPSADNTVDHDVPILECLDASDQRTAVVFGYACHNTTIPPDDLRYCGDWAGFAKEQIQHANPGATALFIPGAGADQNPEPCGSIELSRQFGQQIADAVQHGLSSPGIEITGPIRAEWADVPLAIQPVGREQINKMLECDDLPQRIKAQFLADSLNLGEELITSYSAPVQAVSLGNQLLIIALSGEPVVDWANKLKRYYERDGACDCTEHPHEGSSSPDLQPRRYPFVWVAGYCNDMFGYLPTRRVQSEGGYEGGRSFLWSWIPAPLADDVEDRVTAAVLKLISQVGGKCP